MAPRRKETLEDKVARLERELAGIRASVKDFGGSDAEAERAAAEAAMAWEPVADELETPATAAPTPPPRLDSERRIGLRWLPMIGGGIVILGVTFFFVLFGRELPSLARLILAFAFGAGLWVLGHKLAGHKTSWLPQVLVPLGAVIPYFGFYAVGWFDEYRHGFGWSDNLAFAIALAGMTSIVVGLLAYSYRREDKVLGLTALGMVWFTGLWPVPWPEIRVAYAALMTIGIMVMAHRKNWLVLGLLVSLGGIFMVGQSVSNPFVEPLFMPIRWAASIGILAIVATASILALMNHQTRHHPKAGLMQLAVWLLATMMLLLIHIGSSSMEQGLLVLGLGLGAAAFAWLAAETRLQPHWIILAGIYLLLWPAYQWDGVWIGITWSLILIVSSIVRALQERRGLDIHHAVNTGLVSLGAVGYAAGSSDPMAWLLMTSTAVACAAGVASILAVPASPRTSAWQATLSVTGFLWVIAYLLPSEWVTLAWTLLCMASLGAGFAMGRPELRWAGLGGLIPTLLRFITVEFFLLDLLWRVLAFIGVGLLLLAASYAYMRMEKRVAATA